MDIGHSWEWTVDIELRNLPLQPSSTLTTTESHVEPMLSVRFGRACGSSASLAPSAPRFVVREVVPAWRNRQTRRPGRSLSESSCGFESHRRYPPHYFHVGGDVAAVYIRHTCRVSTPFFAAPLEPEGTCRPAPVSTSNSQSHFQFPISNPANAQCPRK